MSKQRNNLGRPSVLTTERVLKLVDAIKLGLTETKACEHAQISRDTYYRHLKDNADFSDKIKEAKNYLELKALAVIHKAIVERGDLKTAKWYLNKKLQTNPLQTIQQGPQEKVALIIEQQRKEYPLNK